MAPVNTSNLQDDERVLDTIADAHASIDDLVERRRDRVRERYQQLLDDPAERNAYIWQSANAPIDMTILDLGTIPTNQRDELWFSQLSTMLAAAREQCFIELVARDAITVGSDNASRLRLDVAKLTRERVRNVSRPGVGKARFAAARDRLTNGSTK